MPMAEAEDVSATPPRDRELVDGRTHRQRHPEPALRMIGLRYGIVQDHEQAVADEALQGPSKGEGLSPERGVVLAQDRHDFLGLGALREGREAA